MKKLLGLMLLYVLFLFVSCSNDMTLIDVEDQRVTSTRNLDPDPTPIIPGDSLLPPIRPIDPVLNEYEKGSKQANMEVTDNFKRYARANKYKYKYTYYNPLTLTNETGYHVDELYDEFCDYDPWAIDRRQFVITFDEENAGDYMKGYYSILRITIYSHQLPLSTIPWDDIVKGL